MISILIPIYNFDVTELVPKLVDQCNKAKILYEIICFDDGSQPKYKEKNQAILHLMGVNYVELSENFGRSKIRNKLASVASFDYLLFMDCDSKVKYATYIKRYKKEIQKECEVCYGGRAYKKSKPRAKSKILHWKYGLNREALSAEKRAKRPYLNFMSNNFLIRTDIFLDIKFDESIEGYGYEDLAFAERLKKFDIKIDHIENPLEHLGLEKTSDFLNKTEVGIQNLKNLIKEGKIVETRLTKAAYWIDKLGLRAFVFNKLNRREPQIRQNLHSENPSLRQFDFFKLLYFLNPE